MNQDEIEFDRQLASSMFEELCFLRPDMNFEATQGIGGCSLRAMIDGKWETLGWDEHSMGEAIQLAVTRLGITQDEIDQASVERGNVQ